jgi:hypothetical protein
MNEGKSPEIVCPACGAEALLLRQPRYEGFTKVGESLRCAACGHFFAGEDEVPYKHRPEAEIFTDADRSAEVKVFSEGEADRLCRHCVHYVVNPFMQWCGLHKREVEATDTCGKFHRKARRREPEKPL